VYEIWIDAIQHLNLCAIGSFVEHDCEQNAGGIHWVLVAPTEGAACGTQENVEPFYGTFHLVFRNKYTGFNASLMGAINNTT